MTEQIVTKEDLRMVEEANAALLDGHSKISIAYLATRLMRQEEVVAQLIDNVKELHAKMVDQLAQNIERLDTRLDEAAHVIKEVKARQEKQDANP